MYLYLRWCVLAKLKMRGMASAWIYCSKPFDETNVSTSLQCTGYLKTVGLERKPTHPLAGLSTLDTRYGYETR